MVPVGDAQVVVTGSGRPSTRAHWTVSVWVPSMVAVVVVSQGRAGLAMIIRVCREWVATVFP